MQTWEKAEKPDELEERRGGGGGVAPWEKEGRIGWEIKETFGGGKEGGGEARKQVSNAEKMD